MAVVAILLLAVVPTISQVIASVPAHAALRMLASESAPASGHACEGTHSDHVGHEQPVPDEHANPHCRHGDRPGDDCWHKCGYCDFLTHTPALGGFGFLAQFASALPPQLVPLTREQRAHAAYFPAAQPRGPPAL
jgi:hypothetical protein